MDRETQKRFATLWNARPKIRLEDIATELGYSFQSLAKWRMILQLPKRYGFDDDGEIPPPAVIELRCQAQQTNWTPTERRLRWRGPPHTIYESTTTSDFQP
jgi:hypothetical protein